MVMGILGDILGEGDRVGCGGEGLGNKLEGETTGLGMGLLRIEGDGLTAGLGITKMYSTLSHRITL